MQSFTSGGNNGSMPSVTKLRDEIFSLIREFDNPTAIKALTGRSKQSFDFLKKTIQSALSDAFAHYNEHFFSVEMVAMRRRQREQSLATVSAPSTQITTTDNPAVLHACKEKFAELQKNGLSKLPNFIEDIEYFKGIFGFTSDLLDNSTQLPETLYQWQYAVLRLYSDGIKGILDRFNKGEYSQEELSQADASYQQWIDRMLLFVDLSIKNPTVFVSRISAAIPDLNPSTFSAKLKLIKPPTKEQLYEESSETLQFLSGRLLWLEEKNRTRVGSLTVFNGELQQELKQVTAKFKQTQRSIDALLNAQKEEQIPAQTGDSASEATLSELETQSQINLERLQHLVSQQQEQATRQQLIEEEKSAAAAANARLKQELKELKSQQEENAAKQQSLEQQQLQTAETNQKLEQELQKLKAQQTEQLTSREAIEVEKLAALATSKDLEQKLQKLKGQQEENAQRVQLLEEEKSKTSQTNQELEQELKKLRAQQLEQTTAEQQLKEKISATLISNQELALKLQVLEKDQQANAERQQLLEREKSEALERNQQLEQQLSQLKDQLAEQTASRESENSTATVANQQLREQLSALQIERDQLAKRMGEVQQQLAEANRSLESLRTSEEALKSENLQLKKELRELSERLQSTIETARKEKESALAEKSSELIVLTEQLGKITTQLQQLTHTCQTNAEELSRVQRERDIYKEQIESHMKSLRTVQDENDDTRSVASSHRSLASHASRVSCVSRMGDGSPQDVAEEKVRKQVGKFRAALLRVLAPYLNNGNSRLQNYCLTAITNGQAKIPATASEPLNVSYALPSSIVNLISHLLQLDGLREHQEQIKIALLRKFLLLKESAAKYTKEEATICAAKPRDKAYIQGQLIALCPERPLSSASSASNMSAVYQ